jgi:hypothetical protein
MTWSPVLTFGISISGGGAVGWGSIIITMTGAGSSGSGFGCYGFGG